jgi:hypothetical protein
MHLTEVSLAGNPFVVPIFVSILVGFSIVVSILVPIFVGFSSCLPTREQRSVI